MLLLTADVGVLTGGWCTCVDGFKTCHTDEPRTNLKEEDDRRESQKGIDSDSIFSIQFFLVLDRSCHLLPINSKSLKNQVFILCIYSSTRDVSI